jgi:hypothetical protein
MKMTKKLATVIISTTLMFGCSSSDVSREGANSNAEHKTIQPKEKLPAEVISEIVSDYIDGNQVQAVLVYESLKNFEITDLHFDGSLRELIHEIHRQHPRVFWSFGASEAVDKQELHLKIVAEKINLFDLLNEASIKGNFKWDYTLGKGLIIKFMTKEEDDVRFIIGY